MQKILGLALVALLAFTYISSYESTPALQMSETKDAYQEYVAWKARYGKNTNGTEDSYRFSVFLQNKKFVEEYNEQEGEELVGLNKFADLTNAEYQDKYLSKITASRTFEEDNEEVEVTKQQTTTYPDEINWLKEGAVTSIKDQGNCGACWAFAGTANIEGLRAIQTGVLESLSNQQVNSCVTESNGCRGGNALDAFQYAVNTGLTTNELYPYESGTTGKTYECQLGNKKQVFNTKGGQELKETGQALYDELKNQPVTVGVRAGSLAFQLNRGKVIEKNCGGFLNHQVLAIGYDTQTDSFIIKNSWGTGWGENGLGFISASTAKKTGVCGINAYPTSPL